jgi:hypothetical protein
MKRLFITFGLLVLIAGAQIALAQDAAPNTPYDLSWWTVDGGGGVRSGGDYALAGTAGQPDAHVALSGGGYALFSGFWAGGSGGIQPPAQRYLPLVLKQG